jgi:hypothetical protein
MDSDSARIPSIVPELLGQGLANFLDAALHNIVLAHKDDIHDIVDAILHKHSRGSGKGHLKSATLKSIEAPVYTQNDPAVDPPAATVRHGSFASHATRSVIEPLAERKNSIKLVGELYEDAARECRSAVKYIIAECQKQGKPFFDSSFYFDRRDNVYPEGSPADCTVSEPKIAKRLHDLYPSARLFADDINASDLIQGNIGDCFLIGAISAAAANDPEMIQRLFVEHDVAIGIYGLVFYKSGGWEWVIVDDLVPCQKERSGNLFPLYCSSTDAELWPNILEKAYAKLHYNWDTIDGGETREAVEDMTGGAGVSYNLYTEDKGMSFKTFHAIVSDQLSVVGCSVGNHIEETNSRGSSGEAGAVCGLFKGHAYGVLETKLTSDGVGFVNVRNPWGNSEWQGPYSDNSPEWRKNPLHKSEINPTFGDDGNFWMCWNDFSKYMTNVEVVYGFPPNYHLLTMYLTGCSEFTPASAYILQISGSAKLTMTLVLSQDDPKVHWGSKDHDRQKNTPYGVLRMTMYKLRGPPGSEHEKLPMNLGERKISLSARERTIMQQIDLDDGYYCIGPSIKTPSSRQSSSIGLYFRIVGPPEANYALWRWNDEAGKLVVGKCSPHDGSDSAQPPAPPTAPQLREDDHVTVPPATPALGVAQDPSSQVIIDQLRAQSEKDGAQLHALTQELEESQLYLKHLESLIRTQQEQLAAANARAAHMEAQYSASTAPSAFPEKQPPSQPYHNDPSSAQPSRPLWVKMGMTKKDWDDLNEESYKYISRGKQAISIDEALNGMRTVVTVGLGLEALMERHDLVRHNTKGSLNKQEFQRLISDVLSQWGFSKLQ